MNNLFTCSTWQTIDNAPNDRPILTNLGLAIYVKGSPWGERVNGWCLCDSLGEIPDCREEGIIISKLYKAPTIWTEFNPPQID